MQAHPDFRNQDKRFWANVRMIGQSIGYTRNGQVRVYTLEDLKSAMVKSNLGTAHLASDDDMPTALAKHLLAYFTYRADVLNNTVEPNLMDADRAEAVFNNLYQRLQPNCPIPMNKQRGEKKQVAYLTAIVNMLVEAYAGGLPCEYDPSVLTTIVKDNAPLRTLARRVDGCFPTCTNPIAIWEIKEYYHTTTFGSRIADGVYPSPSLPNASLGEGESIAV